ncbi:MAG: hypothetical protein MK384_09700, partial [SAR202 cluster bacterium]|nr:hypothetical protein [SAR202 cluster bacterium]
AKLLALARCITREANVSKLLTFRNRNLLILVPIISSLLLVVLACGGDDGDTASASSAAAPAAKPPATTAAAQHANAAASKAPAATGGPSRTLTAALKTVGTPIGTPGLSVPGCANEKYFYSAFDTILQWHVDGKVVPAVEE